MKKLLLLTAAIGLTASALLTTTPANAASASLKIKLQHYIVTAPTSASNSFCLQNVFDDMEKQATGSGIYVPIGTRANDPVTVNSPGVLRGCQIIYSSAFTLWDGVLNPTGNFATQYGSRLAWGLTAEDRTNAFLASDIYFALSSSDSANTLGYTGNVATNTANNLALTFSSTLRGEVLDVNGNVTASYHNGELVATHPVNRVYALIRIGYFASSTDQVGLNLNYFKNHMQMTNFAAFYAKDGSGTVVVGQTNQLTSRVHPSPNVQASVLLNKAIVDIEGQRQMGLGYILWRKSPLNSSNAWVQIGTSGPEGYFVDTNFLAEAYYKASEGPMIAQTFLSAPYDPKYVPTLQVYNAID